MRSLPQRHKDSKTQRLKKTRSVFTVSCT